MGRNIDGRDDITSLAAVGRKEDLVSPEDPSFPGGPDRVSRGHHSPSPRLREIAPMMAYQHLHLWG